MIGHLHIAWELMLSLLPPDACVQRLLKTLGHLEGSVLTAADIKARPAAVLKDRFATICSVSQALERASTAGA